MIELSRRSVLAGSVALLAAPVLGGEADVEVCRRTDVPSWAKHGFVLNEMRVAGLLPRWPCEMEYLRQPHHFSLQLAVVCRGQRFSAAVGFDEGSQPSDARGREMVKTAVWAIAVAVKLPRLANSLRPLGGGYMLVQ